MGTSATDQPRERNGQFASNLAPVIAALDQAPEHSRVLSKGNAEFVKRRKLGGDLAWTTTEKRFNFISVKRLATIADVLNNPDRHPIPMMRLTPATVPETQAQGDLFS